MYCLLPSGCVVYQLSTGSVEDVKLVCDALKKIENVLKAVRLFDAE